MKKAEKHVWITCSERLEPVYARLVNGRALCSVCGQLFPLSLEGQEAPASEPPPAEPEELPVAS